MKHYGREFPGGPVVGTQRSHGWGPGSIPGLGTKIPQWETLPIGKSLVPSIMQLANVLGIT